MHRKGSLWLFAVIAVMVVLPLVGCQSGQQGERFAAHYSTAAVAADYPAASQAGLEVLQMGGNAVDAAVATSFALSVVRPQSCGIGGGGFMLIHLQDDPKHGTIDRAIDYRERAPAGIGPDHFENLPKFASRHSGHAVAVPGTVAGLLHALDTYGTLDRRVVLAPAIRLAREGFAVDAAHRSAIETLATALSSERRTSFPESDAFLLRTYIERPDDAVITNPYMAQCLQIIADHGAEAFYDGPIAGAIVSAVQRSGGVMTANDLRTYRLSEMTPLRGSFMGRTVLAMPLPSSGGITMLETLGILERFPLILRGARGSDPDYLHLLAEAFAFAFADRAVYLGDPEFMQHDPTGQILDPKRITARAGRLDMQQTHGPEYYAGATPLPDDSGTSHFCVVDVNGSAVSCTETINLTFGSKIAVPEYGFCLNNEMDDFLTRRGEVNAFGLTQSERNLPEPGKRPLSSMSPTIVLDEDGTVEVVAGASGGPRIITATTQAILNVLLLKRPAGRAVSSPRIHHQWQPDVLGLEPGLMGISATAGELAARGHSVVEVKSSAVVQLIRRTKTGWQAASDPRKGGKPAGY